MTAIVLFANPINQVWAANQLAKGQPLIFGDKPTLEWTRVQGANVLLIHDGYQTHQITNYGEGFAPGTNTWYAPTEKGYHIDYQEPGEARKHVTDQMIKPLKQDPATTEVSKKRLPANTLKLALQPTLKWEDENLLSIHVQGELPRFAMYSLGNGFPPNTEIYPTEYNGQWIVEYILPGQREASVITEDMLIPLLDGDAEFMEKNPMLPLGTQVKAENGVMYMKTPLNREFQKTNKPLIIYGLEIYDPHKKTTVTEKDGQKIIKGHPIGYHYVIYNTDTGKTTVITPNITGKWHTIRTGVIVVSGCGLVAFICWLIFSVWWWGVVL